jgi:hypothetical protein
VIYRVGVLVAGVFLVIVGLAPAAIAALFSYWSSLREAFPRLAGMPGLLVLAIVVAGVIAAGVGEQLWRRSLEGIMACPHCAEKILREARVCRHCSRDVTSTPL